MSVRFHIGKDAGIQIGIRQDLGEGHSGFRAGSRKAGPRGTDRIDFFMRPTYKGRECPTKPIKLNPRLVCISSSKKIKIKRGRLRKEGMLRL